MSGDTRSGSVASSVKRGEFRLRLYVAGDSPNSAVAIANLRAICAARLANRHAIEIVDLLRDPSRALADGVMVTPLLVKLSPEPVCRIAGTLSDERKVTHALGIPGGGE